MKQIMGWQIIGLLATTLPFGYVKYKSASGPTFEFCHGHSVNVDKIILEYQRLDTADIEFDSKLLLIGGVPLQIIHFAELLIYFYLYVYQYNHNKNMVRNGVLSGERLRQRQQRNVVTMSGQAMTFLVQLTFFAIAQVSINVKSVQVLEPASLPVYLIVVSALVSLTQICASPEMRDHYFKI